MPAPSPSSPPPSDRQPAGTDPSASVDPRLLGVVACGGASRRMGVDKARLELRGVPLALRAARILESMCGAVALASGDAPRLADLSLLELADARPRGPRTGDDAERLGPLAGLVAALEHAETRGYDRVVYLACDLALADVELVAPLVARIRSGADVALWTTRGLDEPLCAAYAVRCAAPARAALDGGARRMIAPWEASGLRVERLAADEARAARLFNVNTPHDLEQLAARTAEAAR